MSRFGANPCRLVKHDPRIDVYARWLESREVMGKPTGDQGNLIVKQLAIALAGAACAWPAMAAEEDVQPWFTANAVTSVSDDTTATFSISQRFRKQGDQRQVRGQADMTANKWLLVGGGLTFSDTGGADEWRLHQHVTALIGPLQFRSQIEQRFFVGAPQLELRLRQRVQGNFDLTRDDQIMVYGELLYIARPMQQNQDPRVDQYRLMGVYQRALAPGLRCGAGYLLIYSPRDGSPDRLSHAPQVTMNYRF